MEQTSPEIKKKKMMTGTQTTKVGNELRKPEPPSSSFRPQPRLPFTIEEDRTKPLELPPAVVEKKADEKLPVQVQGEGQWDVETVELLIDTLGETLKLYSRRASLKIEERKNYLAKNTTPVLNKYIPTALGVEINCALAWGIVAMEIVREVQLDKAERKKLEVKV